MERINTESINIKSINDFSLLKIGNFIKEARIKRNQSINELAANVKISEQQLKAIEDGRDDLLPEKVFVKAMVKKISEKLKLDTNILLAEFNNQNEENKAEEISAKVKKNTKIKKSLTLRFLLNIIISGIVGFAASSYIFNLLFGIDNQSETKSLSRNIK